MNSTAITEDGGFPVIDRLGTGFAIACDTGGIGLDIVDRSSAKYCMVECKLRLGVMNVFGLNYYIYWECYSGSDR